MRLVNIDESCKVNWSEEKLLIMSLLLFNHLELNLSLLVNAISYFKKKQETHKNTNYSKWKKLRKTMMISVDLSQAAEVPSNNFREGQLYFLSPLKIGLLALTVNGSEEHATLVMTETI